MSGVKLCGALSVCVGSGNCRTSIVVMTSYHGSSSPKKESSFLTQHSHSSPNVLEYLTSPPPSVSDSSLDLKIRSTILPGRRTRSPSPTPPCYPGYVASGMRVNLQSYSTSNNLKSTDANKYGSSFTRSRSQSPLMSNYLGDCVKYPTNRNYSSNLCKGPGLPPSPRKIQNPGTLLPDSNFCLSCPPASMQLMAAMRTKESDPDAPGEVRIFSTQI